MGKIVGNNNQRMIGEESTRIDRINKQTNKLPFWGCEKELERKDAKIVDDGESGEEKGKKNFGKVWG